MKKIIIFILSFIFSISYAEDIKIITKEIKDSSANLRYHISAKYPQLEGMKNKANQNSINNEIFNTAKNGIDDFRDVFTDLHISDIPKDFNSELDYAFTIYNLDTNLLSMAYEVFCYNAGAAHPNHWTISMNFNLRTGKRIFLKDLFKPEINYLQKISSYCISDLQVQAHLNETEFFDYDLQQGAGPKDSNFLNFNFIQRGIQFTFDPYQVACYASGTQYVIIPYSALFDLIKEDILDLIPNF